MRSLLSINNMDFGDMKLTFLSKDIAQDLSVKIERYFYDNIALITTLKARFSAYSPDLSRQEAVKAKYYKYFIFQLFLGVF